MKIPGQLSAEINILTIGGNADMAIEALTADDIEVVEGIGSVNMGEIEIDYGDVDDYDDYREFQLMLSAGEKDVATPIPAERDNGSDAPAF